MRTIAVVDLGSNTIRLSVYRVDEGLNFERLFSQKEMAGLVNYISAGVLSPEGIERACTALTDFQELLTLLHVREVHVFATASLRNIRNTDEAVETIRRRTGLFVDVLPGPVEAELGYYGALRTLDLRSGALFDIGGGSTELVQVRRGRILQGQSLPLGSLTLFNAYVSGVWPKEKELKAIREAARRALQGANLPKKRVKRVIGVGGTARAVLKIANASLDRPEEERRLTPEQLHELTGILTRRDQRARKLILNACPDRLHTLLPGIVLMDTVCRRLCSEMLYISPFGVREGYLCRRLLHTEETGRDRPEHGQGGA